MIDPPPPETGCPRCAARLVPGAPACAACGLRLVGADAAELWALDQQASALSVRRGQLLAALAPGAPAAPAPPARPVPPALPSPVPAPVAAPLPPAPPLPPPAEHRPARDPYSSPGPVPGPASGPLAGPPTGPVPGPQPGAAPAAAVGPVAPPRQRRFGAQQLLLVTGVVAIVVAAVVFTARVWDGIGALGQAAVLIAVCAGAAAGSRTSARHRLGASAEALAVLSLVVLLVLVGAARSLDVLGLGGTDAGAYRLGGLLLAVAAAAAGDRWLRTGGRPTALAWGSVVLTAAVPSVLAVAVHGELLTWACAALVLAVLSVPASRPLARRAPGLGVVGLVIGGAHLVTGVLALLVVDVDAGQGAWQPVGAAVELALLAGASAWLAARCARPPQPGPAPGVPARELLAGRPAVRRVAVVVAYGGVVGALVSLAVAGGASALLFLALGIAVTAGVLVAVRPALLPWPVLVSALALAGGSLLSEPVVGQTEGTWWRPVAWYALAAAALVVGQRRPVPGPTAGTTSGPTAAVSSWASREPALQVPRAVWAVAAGLAALGGSLLAPAPLSGPGAVTSAVVAATALLALSALRRGAPELALVGGWAATALGSVVIASDGPVHVSVPLGVAGLAALLRAGARDRTAWVVPGVALLAVAWWSETDALAPPGAGVEWWSLPPALLALAVGVLVWQRHPQLGSWAALGAGLAAGLLPSALQAAAEGTLEGGGWRVALVAVAGAAVCAAGVRWGWQAPVVLGAAAALLVAIGQLGPYALRLQASVGLFVAGAVVIVLAVRIEQARRDAARALGWVRALR